MGGAGHMSIESLLWLGVALVPCCQAQTHSDFVTSLWVVLQVLWHLENENDNRHDPNNNSRPVQSSLRRRGGGMARPRSPAVAPAGGVPTTTKTSRHEERMVRWKTSSCPSNSKQNDSNNNLTKKTTTNDDADGRFMGMVLPHALWQGLSLRVYARYTLLGSAIWWWRSSPQKGDNLLHAGGTFLLLLAVLMHSDDVYCSTQAIPFCLLWWILYYAIIVGDRISQAVTPGEWFVVTNFTAVALTEWLRLQWLDPTTTRSDEVSDDPHFYAGVAVAGLVGCALACVSVECYDFQSRCRTNTSGNWWRVTLRGMVMVVMALGTVEVTMFHSETTTKHHSYHWWIPECLHWMFAHFLWTVELPMIAIVDNHDSFLWKITNLPRGVWLLYWLVILVVTLPLAPTAPSSNNDMHNNNNNNRAILLARKWFHLVAVLLFAPVTVLAPQLMSLSYAVAIGLLLLLESLRHHVSWLDQFYYQYLDVHNKQERSNLVVISHLALIVGCAVPLWLAQWLSTMTTTMNSAIATSTTIPPIDSSLRLILSLWGIVVTGIGDAMGAVIGATYGRRYWGHHRRTVEGSLAMLASLGCALMTMEMMIDPNDRIDWRRWLPVCVVATLLEAFTLQIDNLVLPLVGVALLLFF